MEKNDKHTVSLGTLYDFNKQLMLNQGQMSNSEIKKITPDLEQWFNMFIDEYVMLLCRERYDFTVFHLYSAANQNSPQIAVSELIDLLKSRGKILSIEKDTDVMNNAWEIWVEINDDVFAYYLFRCDDWVIEC